jgi:hypothetical protein
MSKDISILITSCDKFYDTWEIVTQSFEDYWPDCPYDIFLMTNEIPYTHSKFKNIQIGKDESWSINLKKALHKINSKYVLIWLDDVFLSKKVDNYHLDLIEKFIKESNLNFLRLRATPVPSKWNGDFGEIYQNALFYRVSIFASIWDINILNDLLIDVESAWDFEIKGSIRSSKYDKFYCIRNEPFTYIHGIEKGLWKIDALNWLKNREIDVDLMYRRSMTYEESKQFRSSKWKNLLLNILPPKYKYNVLYLYQKISVKLNYKKSITFIK